jgi:DNA-binding HxlR family transcriptional regulator
VAVNFKEAIPVGEESAQVRMSEYCEQYSQLMGLLSRRWTGIILRVLMSGPHRYNQILAAIPSLSDPLLTQRLREMEAKGLVLRRVLPESPVRVEYELTEAGLDLEPAVRALSDWASKWWAPGEHQEATETPAP